MHSIGSTVSRGASPIRFVDALQSMTTTDLTPFLLFLLPPAMDRPFTYYVIKEEERGEEGGGL